MKSLRHTKPFVCVILASTLLITHVVFPHNVEANFWAERRAASQKTSDPIQLAQLPSRSPLTPFSQPTKISTNLLSVPKGMSSNLSTLIGELSALGVIRDVSMSKSPNAPVVFYIQDIHGQLEAQKNIGSLILKVLTRDSNALVGLEGAQGRIPVEKFRIASHDITKEVGSFFRNTRLITGAEYSGFAADKAPRMVGIEDATLYLKNVAAVKAVLPTQTKMQSVLSKQFRQIQDQKKKVYSPAMLALDTQWQNYIQGKLHIGNYLTALNQNQALLNGYPNIDLFLKTWKLEQELKFEQVERERSRFVLQLTRRLSKESLDHLVQQTYALKAGAISYPDYFRQLKAIAQAAQSPLSQAPEFHRYIEYVLQADQLNAERLLSEILAYENAVWKSLCETNEQMNLRQTAVRLALAEKLVKLNLTREEWGQYKAVREVRKVRSKSEINKGNKISDLSDFSDSRSLKAFEQFYEIAEQRDVALVNNFHNTLKTENPKTAVLVAGGFHSSGIQALLKDRNVSIVTITPKITKLDSSETDYLSVFTRERAPIEKLFDSPKITLIDTLKTNPIPGADVSPEFLQQLTEETVAALKSPNQKINRGDKWVLAEAKLETASDQRKPDPSIISSGESDHFRITFGVFTSGFHWRWPKAREVVGLAAVLSLLVATGIIYYNGANISLLYKSKTVVLLATALVMLSMLMAADAFKGDPKQDVVAQIQASMRSAERPVIITENDFETSLKITLNVLGSGNPNAFVLRGIPEVYGDFLFDDHPKVIGVSREQIVELGEIQLPEDGVIDPSSWTEAQKDTLKQKIRLLRARSAGYKEENALEFRLKIGRQFGYSDEEIKAGKLASPKGAKRLMMKIGNSDVEEPVYTNTHIYDLWVQPVGSGKPIVIKTIRNSPVISSDVKILGVGPETIRIWSHLINQSDQIIVLGKAPREVQRFLQGKEVINVTDPADIQRLTDSSLWPKSNGEISKEQKAFIRVSQAYLNVLKIIQMGFLAGPDTQERKNLIDLGRLMYAIRKGRLLNESGLADFRLEALKGAVLENKEFWDSANRNIFEAKFSPSVTGTANLRDILTIIFANNRPVKLSQKDFLDNSILLLGISTKAARSLYWGKIVTIRQLISAWKSAAYKKPADLPLMGESALSDLKFNTEKLGLRFNMSDAEIKQWEENSLSLGADAQSAVKEQRFFLHIGWKMFVYGLLSQIILGTAILYFQTNNVVLYWLVVFSTAVLTFLFSDGDSFSEFALSHVKNFEKMGASEIQLRNSLIYGTSTWNLLPRLPENPARYLSYLYHRYVDVFARTTRLVSLTTYIASFGLFLLNRPEGDIWTYFIITNLASLFMGVLVGNYAGIIVHEINNYWFRFYPGSRADESYAAQGNGEPTDLRTEKALALLEKFKPTEGKESEDYQATIDFIRSTKDWWKRSHLIGHVTTSAWVVDTTRTKVLLTRHKKLNEWVQLGGHIEQSDSVLQAAAHREAVEESSMSPLDLIELDSNIFDLNVRTIPQKDEVAEHLHFDIRFILQARTSDIHISDESDAVAWVEIAEIAKGTNPLYNPSLVRMAQKFQQRPVFKGSDYDSRSALIEQKFFAPVSFVFAFLGFVLQFVVVTVHDPWALVFMTSIVSALVIAAVYSIPFSISQYGQQLFSAFLFSHEENFNVLGGRMNARKNSVLKKNYFDAEPYFEISNKDTRDYFNYLVHRYGIFIWATFLFGFAGYLGGFQLLMWKAPSGAGLLYTVISNTAALAAGVFVGNILGTVTHKVNNKWFRWSNGINSFGASALIRKAPSVIIERDRHLVYPYGTPQSDKRLFTDGLIVHPTSFSSDLVFLKAYAKNLGDPALKQAIQTVIAPEMQRLSEKYQRLIALYYENSHNQSALEMCEILWAKYVRLSEGGYSVNYQFEGKTIRAYLPEMRGDYWNRFIANNAIHHLDREFLRALAKYRRDQKWRDEPIHVTLLTTASEKYLKAFFDRSDVREELQKLKIEISYLGTKIQSNGSEVESFKAILVPLEPLERFVFSKDHNEVYLASQNRFRIQSEISEPPPLTSKPAISKNFNEVRFALISPMLKILQWASSQSAVRYIPTHKDVLLTFGSDSLRVVEGVGKAWLRAKTEHETPRILVAGGIGPGTRTMAFHSENNDLEDPLLMPEAIHILHEQLDNLATMRSENPELFWSYVKDHYRIERGRDEQKKAKGLGPREKLWEEFYGDLFESGTMEDRLKEKPIEEWVFDRLFDPETRMTTKIPEALVCRALLLAQGVDKGVILTEAQSTTTDENVRFVSDVLKILKPEKVYFSHKPFVSKRTALSLRNRLSDLHIEFKANPPYEITKEDLESGLSEKQFFDLALYLWLEPGLVRLTPGSQPHDVPPFVRQAELELEFILGNLPHLGTVNSTRAYQTAIARAKEHVDEKEAERLYLNIDLNREAQDEMVLKLSLMPDFSELAELKDAIENTEYVTLTQVRGLEITLLRPHEIYQQRFSAKEFNDAYMKLMRVAQRSKGIPFIKGIGRLQPDNRSSIQRNTRLVYVLTVDHESDLYKAILEFRRALGYTGTYFPHLTLGFVEGAVEENGAIPVAMATNVDLSGPLETPLNAIRQKVAIGASTRMVSKFLPTNIEHVPARARRFGFFMTPELALVFGKLPIHRLFEHHPYAFFVISMIILLTLVLTVRLYRDKERRNHFSSNFRSSLASALGLTAVLCGFALSWTAAGAFVATMFGWPFRDAFGVIAGLVLVSSTIGVAIFPKSKSADNSQYIPASDNYSQIMHHFDLISGMRSEERLDELNRLFYPVSSTRAPPELLSQLVPEDFFPGAHRISEVTDPNVTVNWSNRAFQRLIQTLIDQGAIPPEQKESLVKQAKQILARLESFPIDHEHVYSYYYTSSTRTRIIALVVQRLVFGFGTFAVNPDEKRNGQINQLALAVLKKLSNDRVVSKREDYVVALMNGFLLKRQVVIDPTSESEINSTANDFKEKMLQSQYLISAQKAFYENYVDSQAKRHLAFVLDDNGETVFTLAWIQRLMHENPNLSVTLLAHQAPAMVDASSSDVMKILSDDYFSALQMSMGHGRLKLLDEGIQGPGLDLKASSRAVAQSLLDADAVVGQGQSFIETSRGLKKETWALSVVGDATFSWMAGFPSADKISDQRWLMFYHFAAGQNYFDAHGQRKALWNGIVFDVHDRTILETVLENPGVNVVNPVVPPVLFYPKSEYQADMLKQEIRLGAPIEDVPAYDVGIDVTYEADIEMGTLSNDEVSNLILTLQGPIQQNLLQAGFDFSGANPILNRRFAAQLQELHRAVADYRVNDMVYNAAYLGGRAQMSWEQTKTILLGYAQSFETDVIWLFWSWLGGVVRQFLLNVLHPVTNALYSSRSSQQINTNHVTAFHVDALWMKGTVEHDETLDHLLQRIDVFSRESQHGPEALVMRRPFEMTIFIHGELLPKLYEAAEKKGISRQAVRNYLVHAKIVNLGHGLVSPSGIIEDLSKQLKTSLKGKDLDLYTAMPQQINMHEAAVKLIVYALQAGMKVLPISKRVEGARVINLQA